MHKICEYIDDELMELEQKVEKGGKLSAGEIEYGDKLAHFKKSLLTNEAMEGNSEEGRSYARGRGGRNRSYRSYDNSYDSYDGDMSEARGRNARRDSRGRYSRDGFVDKLMEMRESAPNEKSRRAGEKMIDELEN